MSAVIINVGSELLSGDVPNSNFLFLTQKLQEEGIDVVAQITVGDERGELVQVLKNSLSRYSRIFITGGLGPTEDDITREAVSYSTGKPLILEKKVLKEIKSKYEKWGKRFLPVHEKMAKIPQGAIPVSNYVGTAPGFYLEWEGRQIFTLPGVPGEMKDMWGRMRHFLIREKNVIIRTRTLKCWGLSESEVNEKIKVFLDKENPRLGITVSPYGVEIRIKAKGGSPRQAEEILEKVERSIKDAIGDNIYAADTTEMEKVVGMLLTLRKKSISVAESCTGGLISHRLTNVPGSSQYFRGGMVVYSNESKVENLGVATEILEKYGAVSKDTAREMAIQVREKMGTDLGVSATGIAGPSGGTREKPVGLVYTALAEEGNCWVEEHRFLGERISVKIKSSQAVLDLIRRYLLGLWKNSCLKR